LSRDCSVCGLKNAELATYCVRCGNYIGNPPVYREQTQPTNLKEQHKSNVKGLIVLIIAIALIFSALGYLIEYDRHIAYIGIEVESTHVAYYVDIVVYVDGKIAYTYEGLKPGGYVTDSYYYEYHLPIWDNTKVIEVKAVSFGGGFGNQTQTQTIIINSGDYKNLIFYV